MLWMAATLDGFVKETGAVFEAKFLLPWSPRQPPLRRRSHLVGTTAIDPVATSRMLWVSTRRVE
jgi:hypothetical protein